MMQKFRGRLIKTLGFYASKLNRFDANLTEKFGINVLNSPFTNKTCAFPFEERDRMGLRGLVPPVLLTKETQAQMYWEEFQQGLLSIASRNPDIQTQSSGVQPDMIRKWKVLQNIQDFDETLFYYILMKNIEKMVPIVYTPTVGWLCSNYSKMFRKTRGMFFTAKDRGNFVSMMQNWPYDDVEAIVVTDGSRILGLGDLGIGGLGISIGKLDLYVAAAGFHPKKVLPVVLDVGTNNEKLLKDPSYIGLRQNRLEGDEYYELVDEFMAAAIYRWPNVLIQFEDFQQKHSVNLLKRYREEILVFNDDIQGTAATALAGILGALRVQNLKPKKLNDMKIVMAGAGSAGMGIVNQLRNFMIKYGKSVDEAYENFYILNSNGLVTRKRGGISRDLLSFARPEMDMDGFNLEQVVEKIKPNILIGCCTLKGMFTPKILKLMKNQPPGYQPIIFPLSNPTSKAECSAEDAMKYTDNTAIFGSGSPFDDVKTDDGKIIRANQANNIYIFPGLALGSVLAKCRYISDGMLLKSAEALAECLSHEDLSERGIYPRLRNIRKVSTHVASRVIQQALKENNIHDQEVFCAAQTDFNDLMNLVRIKQWQPEYRPLVYVDKENQN